MIKSCLIEIGLVLAILGVNGMELMKHQDIEIANMSVNPFFRVMSIYLYFIDGLLVDTGPSVRRKSIIPIFKSWDIEQVAITHYHEDHAGMAPWVSRHVKGDIFVHEKSVPIVNKKAQIPWYREFFSGSRWAFEAVPYPSVIKTDKYAFYPIETAGHTEDHISLFEPNKGWLFTGDLYITPYPKVFLKEESMANYIDSLEKLKQFDYDTVFCAHEGIIENGKEMMNRKLDYLQKIRMEVIRLHELGFSDRAIMKRIFPDHVRLEQLTFGSFSRLNLVRSCYTEKNV